MWGEGRAYGYIYFKKTMPTGNRGEGGAACPGHGSGSRADVVITINNRNSSKQNGVIFRWPSALAPAVAARLAAGCMLRAGESMRLSEHPAGGDSSSLSL